MSDRCGKCKHFGIHGEPHLQRFASGIKFGWVNHCEFDEKMTDSCAQPCEKYVNRTEEENKRQLEKMAIADKYAAMDKEPMQQAEMFRFYQ